MLEMVMEMLEGLGEDVMVDVSRGGDVRVVVQDFEGFDDDYSEVFRELDDEDAVDEVYDRLEEMALRVEGDYVRYFHFDGFVVVWEYASMEI